jgi:hypothetical protein
MFWEEQAMRFSVAAIVAAFVLAACGPGPVSTDAAPVAEGAVFPDLYEGPADILTVTDAGYPMFAVTARVEGYADPVEMLLNHQDSQELNSVEPNDLAGQTVVITVVTQNLPALMSMTYQGQEVFASPGFGPPADAQSITGVLDGAAAATASDLPDVVTVSAPDGALLALEAYVTPQMVAANGQSVTVQYVVRPTRSLTRVAAAAP